MSSASYDAEAAAAGALECCLVWQAASGTAPSGRRTLLAVAAYVDDG